MDQAIEVAKSALDTEDVPVGAVLVNQNLEVVSIGYNRREIDSDATAHAEVVAIREANRLVNDWRLDGYVLVVTLEPCAMCAGAIAQARIKTLVFGAWDEKAGAVGSVWDLLRDPRSPHRTEVVSGVRAEECAELLTNFFSKFR
jgi:tRNA(adenine34) deaminase